MARLGFASFSMFILAISMCHAAEPPRRVQPPQWSQDVLDAFFVDAREQLVGVRPQQISRNNAEQSTAQPTEQPINAKKWSALIDAETLTAEIKRINNQLTVALKKRASFQSGGYLVCQRDFGLLAVLFGVIDEFERDDNNPLGRWQRSAKQMQRLCFLAGQKCEAATAQSYSDAKETHALLGELLRGQAPAGETASQGADALGLVDLSLLMQSMEVAMKERLKTALANTREFRKRSQLAAEQAQLLAVLALVIQKEDYGYADEDAYLDEARQLGKAAQDLTQAARDKNYEAARAAAGRIGQSCSRCHEGFRG